MSTILSDILEVRALLAILLTLTMIAAIFTGHLEAKEMEIPFSLVLGFYFATTKPTPPSGP